MRRFTCLLLVLVGVAAVPDARSQPSSQPFVSIAFHDVVDRPDQLETDAVTAAGLAQFFDWLKGTGWNAISLDDVAAAARGVRPLPDKPILISFDDGYESLYTRVFPLIKIYRYPIVAALVGNWMEGGRPDGTVLYGDRVVPSANFISWVTSTMVRPSCARSAITLRTSPTSSGSSAEVGSSNSMTRGWMASALAMAPRCCWPPERKAG